MLQRLEQTASDMRIGRAEMKASCGHVGAQQVCCTPQVFAGIANLK